MSYLHIENLYKGQDILLFKECFALEKIHGTSAHISWRDGKLNFSSGGTSAKAFRALFDEPTLAAKFAEHIGVAQPATVYGEAYGGKEQGMSTTYGKALKFIVFDVKIGELWLAVPQAHDLAWNLGLEFVHYVQIPTTLEAINAIRDEPSSQAIRNGIDVPKMREGVVLRPLIEVKKNNGERIICKHKRDEFRETATIRSVEVDPARLQVLQDAERIADEWVTAARLQHVLGKLPQGPDNPLTQKRTREVISAMLEDVLREGMGEFEDTGDARKAISKKAANSYLHYLSSQLRGETP